MTDDDFTIVFCIEIFCLLLSQCNVIVLLLLSFPCNLYTCFRKKCHHLIVKLLLNASLRTSVFISAIIVVRQIWCQNSVELTIAFVMMFFELAPTIQSNFIKFNVNNYHVLYLDRQSCSQLLDFVVTYENCYRRCNLISCRKMLFIHSIFWLLP